jgi:hypothetical protein
MVKGLVELYSQSIAAQRRYLGDGFRREKLPVSQRAMFNVAEQYASLCGLSENDRHLLKSYSDGLLEECRNHFGLDVETGKCIDGLECTVDENTLLVAEELLNQVFMKGALKGDLERSRRETGG